MKTKPWTWRDYSAMPNDGGRYELHDGELVPMPGPDLQHQRILVRLGTLLHAAVTRHGLGETILAPFDVILSEFTIVQPDLLFIGPAGPGVLTERGLRGAPTLAIEILSASTSNRDRGVKRDLYARHGTPWYWIVDPDARRILVHRLLGTAFTVECEVPPPDVVALPPLEAVPLDLPALWLAG